MILITIGVSILVREAALLVWGQQVRALPYFTGNEVTSLAIGDARVSPQVLWTVGVCAVMVVLITAFFRWAMLGRQMRACASNRVAAALCGLSTRNLVTLSFVLSAGMGALAGCVVCPISQTQYGIGAGLAIKGFTVAILGGLGNSLASVAAGLVLGLIESFSVSLMPTLQGRGGGHRLWPSLREVAACSAPPSLRPCCAPRGSHRWRSSAPSRWCSCWRCTAAGLLTDAADHVGPLHPGGHRAVLLMGFARQIRWARRLLRHRRLHSAALTTRISPPTAEAAWLGPASAGVLVSRPDLCGGRVLVVHAWAASGCAVALSAMLAFLVGIPVLRLKGHYLAMATLGVGTIIFSIALGTQSLGAADGISSVPPFEVLPGLAVSGSASVRVSNYYLACALLAGGMLLLLNLIDSRVGRALRAIHGAEDAARAMGVDTAGFKLRTFVLSAVMAAVAGVFLTHYTTASGPPRLRS
jgi:ABC-type branched-subunit amino acid transport system permease subunit